MVGKHSAIASTTKKEVFKIRNQNLICISVVWNCIMRAYMDTLHGFADREYGFAYREYGFADRVWFSIKARY